MNTDLVLKNLDLLLIIKGTMEVRVTKLLEFRCCLVFSSGRGAGAVKKGRELV